MAVAHDRPIGAGSDAGKSGAATRAAEWRQPRQRDDHRLRCRDRSAETERMRDHRGSIVPEQLEQRRDGKVVDRARARCRSKRTTGVMPPSHQLSREPREIGICHRRGQELLLDEGVRNQLTAKAGDHRRPAGQTAASRSRAASGRTRESTLIRRRTSAESITLAISSARAAATSARRSNSDR